MSDEDLFYQPGSIYNQSKPIDWQARAEAAEAKVKELEPAARRWEIVKKFFVRGTIFDTNAWFNARQSGKIDDTLEDAVDRLGEET